LDEKTVTMKIMRPPGSRGQLGLIELAKSLPPMLRMVEVGSHIGESARIFLDNTTVEKIFCVDDWSGNNGEEREAEFDKFCDTQPKITKVKLNSLAASEWFMPNVLDFVYIDADHSYGHIKQDIALWTPKVKVGGYIGGHDYTWKFKDVILAVSEKFDRPDHVFRDGSWLVQLK
jgi:predicted O-methyltransferase YrrM